MGNSLRPLIETTSCLLNYQFTFTPCKSTHFKRSASAGREGHRLFADGLLCLLLFHIFLKHLIRSQTIDQHLPAHLPMRFLPFLLGGFRDAQLGKDLLRREEVFCPFLRRKLVQLLCFVDRVTELLTGSMSSRSISAAAMSAAGWLRISSFTFIPHLPLETCAMIAHVSPTVLTRSGESRCPLHPM